MAATRSLWALTLLCTVLFSCKENKDRFVTFLEDSFLRHYELKGRIIENEIPLRRGTLLFIDSTFVVTHVVSGNNYFHFFRYSDLSYEGSGGIIGQGPGEIINPFAAIPDAARRGIWCMDRGRNELLYYPLDSLLSNPSFLPDTRVPLPDVQYIIVSYSAFGDSLFSFFTCEPDILVSFFDFRGQVRENLIIPDLIHEEYFDPQNPCQVTFLYSFHPAGNKMAVCDRFSDVIYIIGRSGEMLKKLNGPGRIMAKIPSLTVESERTYWELSSDENYLYCLYQGKPLVDNSHGYFLPVFPKRLFIFNWEGKPVYDILFEYAVSSFFLDYQRRRIVTFSPEHAQIVVYDMPEEI